MTDRTVGRGALEAVEAAFVRARSTFGALYLARQTGRLPADEGSLEALERRYRTERGELDAELARRAPEIEAGGLEGEDGLAWRNLRAALAFVDELDGLAPPEVPTAPEAAGGPAAAPTEDDLRARTLAGYAAATASVEIDGETIDRGTALGRLATEPDAGARRRLFEAMAPIWRSMDGDGSGSSPYRRLLGGSAERWRREGSPIEATAVGLGLAPGTFEPMLREVLAAWRANVGPAATEPWDYRFAIGAAARRLAERVPRERLRAINDAHLAALGADPAGLGITYDLEPWVGRPPVPVAFTLSPAPPQPDGRRGWRPARPWVVATYAEGGLGNLAELLHESGHAIHDAAIRTRPALFDLAGETGGFVEGIADVVGWDAHEPAFQARHLGASASLGESRLGRYGEVMLDVCWTLFEIELHRSPDRAPNEVWTELTADGLGIRAHPEWSWWAVRGQLLESPGYMANYALAALAAAAIRARIRAVRGDWSAGDPGWYGFVSERLLRWGAARPPAEVLGEFLSGPVTAEPLLDDLRAARPD
jgi:hypothetical protein